MNRILLFLIVSSLGFNTSFAQKNLNDYKYVIVPNRYSFFDEADRFRLNTLTKFLFKKYNFDALMADQPFPDDLKNDNCLALRTNVIEHKGLMKTKLEVELRDCSNELVFKTKIGETRVKEYKKAYNLALRDAFESFGAVNYKYNGEISESASKKSEPEVVNVEIKPEEEIRPKKQEKIVKIKKTKKQSKKEKVKKTKNVKKALSNVLYAQAIDGGFQVVDSTPKIAMILYNTGKQNTYIVKGLDAVVYQEDGFWYISKRTDESTKTEVLNIKF